MDEKTTRWCMIASCAIVGVLMSGINEYRRRKSQKIDEELIKSAVKTVFNNQDDYLFDKYYC